MEEHGPTKDAASGGSLSDFTIGELLGQGGSATVHRAVSRSHGGEVALKQWATVLDADERERFHEECSLQWNLMGHPNIVRLYWAVAPDTAPPWIAMELFEQSLADRLANGPALDTAEAVAIAEGILSGLAAVHAEGKAHRDVKPANVLLAGPRVALSDFGIAHDVSRSATHPAAGTAYYIAPELLDDRNTSGPGYRSDVYSAGKTIERCFAGEIPAWIEPLLDRATSQNPANRFPDADAFLTELRRWAATAQDTPAPTKPMPDGAGEPEPKSAVLAGSRRLLLAGAGVAALLLGGTAAAVAVAMELPGQAPTAVTGNRPTPHPQPAALTSSAASTPSATPTPSPSPSSSPSTGVTSSAATTGGANPPAVVTPPQQPANGSNASAVGQASASVRAATSTPRPKSSSATRVSVAPASVPGPGGTTAPAPASSTSTASTNSIPTRQSYVIAAPDGTTGTVYVGQFSAVTSLPGITFNTAGYSPPGTSCVVTVVVPGVSGTRAEIYAQGASGWSAAEYTPDNSPSTDHGTIHQQLVTPPGSAAVGDSWTLGAQLSVDGVPRSTFSSYELALTAVQGGSEIWTLNGAPVSCTST